MQPRLPKLLLKRLLRKDLAEEVFGDLEERFCNVEKESSLFRAKLDYWYQAINYLRPFALIKSKTINTMNFGLHKSNLKMGYRSLIGNKWYSLINIGGLSIGLAACVLICQYIYFELSHDTFHKGCQSIHRLIVDKTMNGEDQGSMPYMAHSVGVIAKKEIPEIKDYVRLYVSSGDAVITNPDHNKPFTEEGSTMFFVDDSFLEVFDFPFLQGGAGPTSVLKDKFSVVITERTASKYFGKTNPVGRALDVEGGPSKGTYTVTGVLENPPSNGHLQFDFLFTLENFLELGWGGAIERNYHIPWFATYVKLDDRAKLAEVHQKLDRFMDDHKGEWNPDKSAEEKIRLEPIADIHLKSESYAYPDYVKNKGAIEYIWIFGTIAFLILFIAYFNYINLSTARSMQRAKEVGVRKSIGAQRKQLIGQFVLESVLINVLAALLAIVLVFLGLPFLSKTMGTELTLGLFAIPMFWGYYLAVVLLGSIISGLYPAFILSGFKPVSILGGNKKLKAGNLDLRKGLVTFQFLVSLLLISGTYLVYRQINYMMDQELGMDIEKILVLKGPKVINGDFPDLATFQAYIQPTFKTFAEELANHGSISNVSGSRFIPGQIDNTSLLIQKLGEISKPGKYGRSFHVGPEFLETYGLELIAGSPFTARLPNEKMVIINKEAVRVFGLGSPERAVNEKLLDIDDLDTLDIVGVVDDFHWQSLRDAHQPYILQFGKNERNYISIRMNVLDVRETIAHVERTYREFFPGNPPLDYFFLEDAYNRQYKSETQFGNLFLTFAFLAIFIACIGLFAMVSFSAVLKVKEIGIRKVLGAGTGRLMFLLSKEYLVLLAIALLLAIPVILYGGRAWLEGYAYNINLGLDIFIFPALTMIFISFLTVGHRIYSAVRSNPVESLKSE